MWHPPRQKAANVAYDNLVGYVAALELEIDRLRKQSDFVQHYASKTISMVARHCDELRLANNDDPLVVEIAKTAGELAKVLQDFQEPPDYHPAHDHVTDIELRPLVEKVFLWQQRLHGSLNTQLNLDLEQEQMRWFPIRLRHILDNLISNAFKFRDASKGETRVLLGLRTSPDAYELRLSDNGIGMSTEFNKSMEEVLSRAIPPKPLGVGVGLPVVRVLVEESGGQVSIDSLEGKGTCVAVILPRFDIDDAL